MRLSLGMTEINLTIGTYGVSRRKTYPIVPRAETVTLSINIFAISVYPYRPSLSIPFEYIGTSQPGVEISLQICGLSPPALRVATSPKDNSSHPCGNCSILIS